MGVRLRTKTP